MSESHPLNPYGNNYIEHPYETKLFYKFNSVKQHVHLDEQDEQRIANYSLYFIGGILLASFGTAGTCYGLQRFVFKHYYPRVYEHCQNVGYYYLGLLVAGMTTYSYSILTTEFVENVSRPLMYKYLNKAIENGFDDYEISIKPTDV